MSSDENKAVFCPATLKLGEIHWCVLRASYLMHDKTTIEVKLGEGKLSPIRQEHTDFGKEVGRDEINWWVFKKESDIEELKKQTARALEAAQKLKEASELLSSKRAVTYPELLETLRRFAEGHEQEIDTLYQYVSWLNSRDPLAQLRATGPNPNEQLISYEELEQIRRIWRSEAQDWEDSVPKIWRDVMGEDPNWVADEHPGFSSQDRSILDAICARQNVPSAMLAKLLDIERELQGMSRRSAVQQRIASVLEEDWRSEEELKSSIGRPTP